MVLVYANLNNIHSSREIEKACKRDINFMLLLQGEKAPSYSTISRFRTGRLKKCCENLFYQFVMKLGELGEIEYKNIFIDGTKIEANANKYTFVWKRETAKFEAKLQNKIKSTFKELSAELDIRASKINEKISVDYANKMRAKLNNIKKILLSLFMEKENEKANFKDIMRIFKNLLKSKVDMITIIV